MAVSLSFSAYCARQRLYFMCSFWPLRGKLTRTRQKLIPCACTAYDCRAGSVSIGKFSFIRVEGLYTVFLDTYRLHSYCSKQNFPFRSRTNFTHVFTNGLKFKVAGVMAIIIDMRMLWGNTVKEVFRLIFDRFFSSSSGKCFFGPHDRI